MTTDAIAVDDSLLQSRLQAYLRTPGAERIYSEFSTPWWLSVIMWLVMLIVGFAMVITIRWALDGFKAIWGAVRHGPLFMLSEDPRHHPERLLAMVGHGIIIGPNRRFSLILGSFEPTSQYSTDWLAALAIWLGELYSQPEALPENRALWELLHEDQYQPNRRRRVPEPYARGAELYLFDAVVDLEQAQETPYGTILFLFVATAGKTGELMLLPWAIAGDAVQFAATTG